MMQKFRISDGAVRPGLVSVPELTALAPLVITAHIFPCPLALKSSGKRCGTLGDCGGRDMRAACRQTPPIAKVQETVANIKSQIKRNTTNEKRHDRNKAVKSELKTLTRRVHEAVAAGDADAARTASKVASRAFDKAASKGVIHKHQAANRKSAVAKAAASV